MPNTGAGIVTRLMAGCTTGAMAVAFAQPTDVVKVRFQAQVRLADGARRYNSTLDAYKTIARDEGVRGLWKGACHFTSNLKRIAFYLFIIMKNPSTGFEVTILSLPLGCMPNITRNAIVNCAELVTYDMIKELILKHDLMTGEVVKHAHCCRNCRYQSTFLHIQMQKIKYCGRM